jgi:hypothetical protein
VIAKVEVFSAQPDAANLALVGDMPFDDPVFLRNIDGLGPVKADIATTPFASGRGELYQGSTIPKRNIVFTFGFNPNWEGLQTIASLRQSLYQYFMPEHWCKLRFFSQELPEVDIEGYVESCEPNMFSEDPEMQVSIICPKPDFIEADATIYEGVVDDGSTELVFDYAGTIDTGYELRVDQTVEVPSYTGPFTITHTAFQKDQLFKVDPATVDGIKYFKLTTVTNAKRVSEVYKADGTVNNLLPVMTGDSVWPVLRPGQNIFRIAAAQPGLAWTLAYFNRYGGL